MRTFSALFLLLTAGGCAHTETRASRFCTEVVETLDARTAHTVPEIWPPADGPPLLEQVRTDRQLASHLCPSHMNAERAKRIDLWIAETEAGIENARKKAERRRALTRNPKSPVVAAR